MLDVVGPAIADNAIARAMPGDIKAAGHLLLMLACGGTAAPSLEMCSVSSRSSLNRACCDSELSDGSHRTAVGVALITQGHSATE